MESMIARCLDSSPEKRPSARELVEFMVQLPQQFSMEGSIELSSSEAQCRSGAFNVIYIILEHSPPCFCCYPCMRTLGSLATQT